MYNPITTKWLQGNIHGAHDAEVSGIMHVHPAHKLRNRDGQICRMSENNPYELMHFIEMYTNPGATVRVSFFSLPLSSLSLSIVVVW